MSFKSLEYYLNYSLRLSKIRRKGGSNMFRHQMETLAILMDHGYTDQVLLKAALIHDLLEELPSTDLSEISAKDKEGESVLKLVKEVSIRHDGIDAEPKREFLTRIMTEGSARAQQLKLADRISNIYSLAHADDPVFKNRYLKETIEYIVPFASGISKSMDGELKGLLKTFE